MEKEYHNPVLLEECLEHLNLKAGGTYVDVTFGGGGHSGKILEKLHEGRLLAFDKDADAHRNLIKDPRLELIRSDFRFIEAELGKREIKAVDGILADLGISSHHVDAPERGFSFRFDAPLDMRMDQSQEVSAATLLNQAEEADIAKWLWQWGEVKASRRIARELVRRRALKPLETTFELVEATEACTPQKLRKKVLAQVFQAIRIEVNSEMDGLRELLTGGLKLLAPGGRFVIMSYHSLEDRMVKNFFRFGNLNYEDRRDFYGNQISPLKLITRKAIVPSEQEILANPRARSARLRVAERHT